MYGKNYGESNESYGMYGKNYICVCQVCLLSGYLFLHHVCFKSLILLFYLNRNYFKPYLHFKVRNITIPIFF